MEQCGTVNSEIPSVHASLPKNYPSPNGVNPSPSYAYIIKKKPVDNSGSSNDESIEKISKKVGRKSRKEDIEAEVERLKMQGS